MRACSVPAARAAECWLSPEPREWSRSLRRPHRGRRAAGQAGGRLTQGTVVSLWSYRVGLEERGTSILFGCLLLFSCNSRVCRKAQGSEACVDGRPTVCGHGPHPGLGS